ncbi:hypothetical protein KRR38_27725 [Novosphingobium sp. G106]|uniref:hypothetical protein n=1 Tax=Novosphingobium sp. G106 TaxID=2849500 RepID=UPI001C2CE8E3|nr:hypothetical protein [Novosphingobium sp. G106]MBV1691370.1 hypothetical protein [Novosphingobium sp. G106]
MVGNARLHTKRQQASFLVERPAPRLIPVTPSRRAASETQPKLKSLAREFILIFRIALSQSISARCLGHRQQQGLTIERQVGNDKSRYDWSTLGFCAGGSCLPFRLLLASPQRDDCREGG